MTVRIATFISLVFFAICSICAEEPTKSKEQISSKLVTAEELAQMEVSQAYAEATAVKSVPLTQKQIEHRKLFDNQSTQAGKKLRDQPSTESGVLFVQLSGDSEYVRPRPLEGQKFIQELSTQADVVICGVVTDKNSMLTEKEDFVFSDYEIRITEILKNNMSKAKGLKVGERITVTRIGGTVILDGRLIKAEDDDFLLLHKGLRYLLFLKYIPSTDSYQSFDYRSSFLLIDNRAIKMTNKGISIENGFNVVKNDIPSDSMGGVDATSLLGFVRSTITSLGLTGGDK